MNRMTRRWTAKFKIWGIFLLFCPFFLFPSPSHLSVSLNCMLKIVCFMYISYMITYSRYNCQSILQLFGWTDKHQGSLLPFLSHLFCAYCLSYNIAFLLKVHSMGIFPRATWKFNLNLLTTVEKFTFS